MSTKVILNDKDAKPFEWDNSKSKVPNDMFIHSGTPQHLKTNLLKLQGSNGLNISDNAEFVLKDGCDTLTKNSKLFLDWCSEKELMPVYKTYQDYLRLVNLAPFTYGDPNAEMKIKAYLKGIEDMLTCFIEPEKII
jgi:hypothetical protein